MSRCRVALVLYGLATSLACHSDATPPDQAGSSGDSSGGGSGPGETGTAQSSTGASESSESASSSGELPSPYSDGTTAGAAEPALSGDAASEALGGGLNAFVHDAKPSEIIAAYASLAGLGAFDPDCPEDQQVVDGDQVDVVLWSSFGCTTAAGITFTGFGRLQIETGVVEDDATVNSVELSTEGATLRVEASDGRYFGMSGYLSLETRVKPDSTTASFSLIGDVDADAGTAGTNPVLGGRLRPQGYLFSYVQQGYKAVGGNGSVTGDALGDAVAISFVDALVASDPCMIEPAGQYAVRDQVGFWHDIVFDAATFDGADYQWDGPCDGCGSHVAGGEIDEEAACIAPDVLASLLDWEVLPW